METLNKNSFSFEKVLDWFYKIDTKTPITPQSELEKNNSTLKDYGTIQPWQFAVMIEYGRIQPWTISNSKEETLKLSNFSEKDLTSMGCTIVQFIPKVVGGKNPPVANQKRDKEML